MTNRHRFRVLSLLSLALLSLAAGCRDSGHSLGSAKDRDAAGPDGPAQTGGASGSGNQTATGGTTDTGSAIGRPSAVGGSSGGINSTQSGGASGGASPAGSAATAEYVDTTGRCVRSMDSAVHGCPATYEEALKRKDSCGTACAGPASSLLIYMDYCTPSHGCAYAADSKLLVGYQLASDARDYCGGKSAYATYGQFPSTITYASLDLDENCPAH